MSAAGTPWTEPTWPMVVTYDGREGHDPEGVRLAAEVAVIPAVSRRIDRKGELEVALDEYVPLVCVDGALHVDDGGDGLTVVVCDGDGDVRVLPAQARALAAALIVAADRADAIARGPQQPADGRERP